MFFRRKVGLYDHPLEISSPLAPHSTSVAEVGGGDTVGIHHPVSM